jgi:Uma2 family endonuclease
MHRAAEPPTACLTVADLLESLGDIPPERVRLWPTPGTATERDVIEIHDRENRLFELVDGVLVEKAMGYEEGVLAGWLITYINLFLMRENLGLAAGADGMLKLTTGLVRIPDVSFVSWDRMPGRKRPRTPLPTLAIDLAVEVLSRGNTKAEMDRKLREYLESGARLVWMIDGKQRTIRVYEGPGRPRVLRDGDVLDGGDVLPGFELPVTQLFDQALRDADD